jgi:hypothetical protein
MQLCRLINVAVGRRPIGESAEELEYRCKRNVRSRLKLSSRAQNGWAEMSFIYPSTSLDWNAQHASGSVDVRPVS